MEVLLIIFLMPILLWGLYVIVETSEDSAYFFNSLQFFLWSMIENLDNPLSTFDAREIGCFVESNFTYLICMGYF